MSIELLDVILPETVDLNIAHINNKDTLFAHMTSMLKRTGRIASEQDFLSSLYEREDMGPTYMGNFIAIPHGKSSSVLTATVAFARSVEGFSYKSADEEGEVKIIFMLAIPGDTEASEYLKVLASLARLLMYESFIEALLNAQNYQDVISAIREAEQEHFEK
jgi:PTS system, fructose subfamily, IIA component